MKKITAFFLCVILMVIVFAGCTGTAPAEQAETIPVTTAPTTETDAAEETEPTGIPVAAVNDFKIALIAMDSVDSCWDALKEGAGNAAAELGCEVLELSPVMKDDEQQAEQIHEAVSSECDAIVIAVNDTQTVVSALEEAIAAGLKIVCVDTVADIDAAASLCMDHQAAGWIAGETMLAALEERNITEGTVGIININDTEDFAVQREAGFREVFADTAYTLQETQYGEGDAAKSMTIAENLIDEDVAAILACSEGAVVGSGNAVEDCGAETIVVGFGRSDVIDDLLETGAVHSVVVQNYETMGYDGIKAACAVLNGADLHSLATDPGVLVLTGELAEE